jgi:hypothetical protein
MEQIEEVEKHYFTGDMEYSWRESDIAEKLNEVIRVINQLIVEVAVEK